ncbi:MAG: hypothetical protein IPL53_20210 [Ignavibacteria bacterium]|nr:hypothetical protein [Ignavibacteria bacterium]
MGGTADPATNTITLSGINSFSNWTAGSPKSLASQIKVIVEGLYNISTNTLNMRDTVRAYFRSKSAPYAIVDSAKSVIDSTIFIGNFTFSSAVTDTYYVHIKHRNSLETWSKNPVSYTLGTVMTYDFTNKRLRRTETILF